MLTTIMSDSDPEMDYAALQASFKRYCEIATIDQRYKRTGNSIWDFVDFSNLESVRKSIHEVIASIYKVEVDKVSLLQLVYFKNGRRLTPVEVLTENDVFKALSEYPAYTSNSKEPVKLGASFYVDGKTPQFQQSVDQEPSVVVKTEVEEEATVSTHTVVPVQSVQPLPTASPISHTVTSPAMFTASDDTASSQRSENNSPAMIGQPHSSLIINQPMVAISSPKVIVKEDQFHIHMLEAMNDHRKQETLCDLTLITNDNIIFKVHKIVLISASPYFSSLQEHSVLRDIHNLSDISADTLASLLDYMYGQGLTLSSESVSLIMAASYKLGIHGAIKLCEDYKNKFQTATATVETSSVNAAGTSIPHPVQLVNMTSQQPTLVNVMQKNRRLRKSTPYQSYAAAIRRLRAENNQSNAQVAISQANQQQSQISLLRKDLRVNRHHNLRPKKYVPNQNQDEDMSNDSDSETEDLSLQINTGETLPDKDSLVVTKSKPGIGGRHRREWRDAVSKSQDHPDNSQEKDHPDNSQEKDSEKQHEQSMELEIEIKKEPDDEPQD